MKISNAILIVLLSILVGCADSNQASTDINTDKDEGSSTVFNRIPASHSGITFSNTLDENLSTKENLFDYDFFYNGAGVGLEDLNNDGLIDIVFAGNQVENKVYANKGKLQFKDVTDKSNVNTQKNWATGITFVDINTDGLMDIYITQGGPFEREKRKNLLFINEGEFVFSEQAQKYGLDDMGIGTQSAFFDFDNDGDLDCVVMNENELYGFDPIRLYKIVDLNDEHKYYNSSHLYENVEGKFVDVTKKSGILNPVFGLGLAVSDFNNDNYLDFYIASDYYIPDALYINNHDGTFTDKIKEYVNQISYYGMGVDVADINNDKLQDIFVLDMASTDHVRSKTLMASMSSSKFDYLVNKANFQYQYMFNSLQLNMGNNNYSNVAQMTNVAKTDWSWSILLSDFDNDEDKDLFVTNGYRRYSLDNDFKMKVFNAKSQYNGNVPLSIKQELYYEMPSEKLPNILFENNGFLKFDENANKWGLNTQSFSNGAAQGDLDNDGDLDLVVNNIDEDAFLYENKINERENSNYLKIRLNGKTSEPFAKIAIDYQGKSQFIESKRVRGYMSAVDDDIHFGMGDVKTIDTLTITWLSGLSQQLFKLETNSTIVLNESDANLKLNNKSSTPKFQKIDPKSVNLNYTHKENVYDDFKEEVLLPYKQSNMGPFLAKGDINSDGLTDIFIGGAAGSIGQIFLATDGGFKQGNSKFLEQDRLAEDMESIFFDIDGDQDLDLFIVSGGNEYNKGSINYIDRLYVNDGSGKFTKVKGSSLEAHPFSGKSVEALDYDGDGDLDLIVGNRIIPKNYPKHSPSIFYENKNGQLYPRTEEIAPELLDFGIVNDLIASDFNSDGKMDFIAVGEWTEIGFFQNEGGNFKLISREDDSLSSKGWWYSISETDVNNDGLMDYVVGNVGSNLKFKASTQSPFKIYASDFDENGSNDIVLSNEYNGQYVPVRGRECSSQQMPFILDKFPTFNEFANASIDDIYGNDLSKAFYKEVTNFKSIVLINKGNGRFTKKNLPVIYQSFPILSTVFYDVNKDGFQDAIVAGNIYETEVETPRLDTRSGMVMLSNGKDGYDETYPLSSNLNLVGNIKSIDTIGINGTHYIIALANDGKLQLFKIEQNQQY